MERSRHDFGAIKLGTTHNSFLGESSHCAMRKSKQI